MNFRKTILAMAMLTLFTGLASAQVVVGGNTGQSAGALQCQANVSVPNQLRQEGLTELVGDIVLTCTGGNAPATGSVVPTANITVSLQTNVTSRLLSCANAANCSEATLLIDEPQTNTSGAAGVGPTLGFTQCISINPAGAAVGAGPGGCVQGVSSGVSGPAAGQSGSNCTAAGVCTAAANVFTGLVNQNQVIFNGIPVNPPTTGGFARVFRITNVRANVSSLGGGGLAGTVPLVASISISGSTSIPLTQPVQTVGFIQAGLTTQLRNTANNDTQGNAALPQCGGSTSPVALRTLRFIEGFATSFKTRVSPTDQPGSGQSGAAVQTTPGRIFNSEGGFQLVGTQIGIADFGTRLKAVFNGIPAGVRIFVSTTNIRNSPTPPAANSTESFAQLTFSETGAFNAVPATVTPTGATVPTLVELQPVNGTVTAVWEVINTNPASIEGVSGTPNSTFDFAVFQQFAPNPGANSPAVGQGTVTMSFAPTPSPSTFAASAAILASSTLPIPRFSDANSSPVNILSIVLCQTALLFPFVTNQAGFDTGIAIANTTTDKFGTRPQSGSCSLQFFGPSAPPDVNTGNIATGTVFVTLASTAASGFQGYMIALCNFQLAHGFAFVSDIGARNLAMGYLALVLPTTAGNRNSAGPEGLNN